MTCINIYVEVALLAFLVVCALSVVCCRNLETAIIIFMSFSLILSVLWLVMQAPDLAITEAAVGAGVDTIVFFLTLRLVKKLKEDTDDETKD
ncbi:MAG: DUF4040 domain-containing protein [Clostridia bacterium]|nr:DUF4040 domain-containing protein [Clostridia bacterium]